MLGMMLFTPISGKSLGIAKEDLEFPSHHSPKSRASKIEYQWVYKWLTTV